jgi:hypothetical protein
MRDWVWRTLAGAGAGWVCVPSDTNGALADTLVHSSAADTSIAPIRRRSRRRDRNGETIAQECEAFLAGRFHELCLGDNWQALPGWVWINPLAHADLVELERLAHLSPSRHDPLAFLSYLADEVLLRAGGDELTLKRIQHDILVPLELALLHQSSSDLLKVAGVIRDRLGHPTRRPESLPPPPKTVCS